MRSYIFLQDAHVRVSGWPKVGERREQGPVALTRYTFRAHASLALARPFSDRASFGQSTVR